MKALLALADGTVYEGTSFGASGETTGEVVFNTSMTGYQEILTDPSYRGQIVTMTCPHIGNYGVNPEDMESDRPALSGFIVKEACAIPSNWRSRISLDAYLKEHGIVGICGIDTRSLTRRLRDFGAQEGVISTVDPDPQSLIRKAKSSPGLIGRDLVREVTCTQPYRWTEGVWRMRNAEVGIENSDSAPRTQHSAFAGRFRVVAYDFGIKRNILRMLVSAGCDVTVVPAHTSAAEVLGMKPDGLVLSNGPGDPEGVPYAIQNIRELIGKIPIFGICLGHQILGLALGGKTYKLKFGHHGGNQPVMDLATRKVEITAQNHGFAVDVDSIRNDVDLTHVNLNDKTVEGMSHKRLPIFSIQYHPEASPGPHDSHYLFDRFMALMRVDRRPD